jgi:hypothetical protein
MNEMLQLSTVRLFSFFYLLFKRHINYSVMVALIYDEVPNRILLPGGQRPGWSEHRVMKHELQYSARREVLSGATCSMP